MKTALDVIRMANSKGEVGYAPGGKHEDLPALKAAVDKGWLKYSHTYRAWGQDGVRREIYTLTNEGLEATKGDS